MQPFFSSLTRLHASFLSSTKSFFSSELLGKERTRLLEKWRVKEKENECMRIIDRWEKKEEKWEKRK